MYDIARALLSCYQNHPLNYWRAHGGEKPGLCRDTGGQGSQKAAFS